MTLFRFASTVANFCLAFSLVTGIACGAENDSKLWPFGNRDKAETPEQPGQESSGWLVSSPFANIGWPKLEMPKVEFLPKFQGDGDGPTLTERIASPIQNLSQRGSNMVTSARNSWNRTLDRFRWSNDSAPRVASRPDSSGNIISRMFSSREPEPQGPQTITEWMSQDRLTP